MPPMEAMPTALLVELRIRKRLTAMQATGERTSRNSSTLYRRIWDEVYREMQRNHERTILDL